MGAKRKLMIPLILILVLLTGCSIEQVSMPDLPELDIGSSALAGTVEYVNGHTCTVLITQGDSHFDAATDEQEADVIYVTYTGLEGSKTVLVGDTVTFEYDYASQVSEHLGSPHITVNQIHVD